MHIKRGTVCAPEQRGQGAVQSPEQVNRGPTAARDCTLSVIVLVTITLHLCQMIPPVMQSNMHVDTTAAVSPAVQLNGTVQYSTVQYSTVHGAVQRTY